MAIIPLLNNHLLVVDFNLRLEAFGSCPNWLINTAFKELMGGFCFSKKTQSTLNQNGFTLIERNGYNQI